MIGRNIAPSRREAMRALAMIPAIIAAPAASAATGRVYAPDPSGAFTEAVAKFRRMRADYENHPGHDARACDPDYREQAEAVTRVCHEVSQQFDAVMRIPSPDMAAIATKLDIVLEEYQDFELPEQAIKDIRTDARRLAGGSVA